jgi:hypothetical protein
MYSKFHILSFSVCGRKMSNSFEKAINIGVCVSFVQGIFNRFSPFATTGSAQNLC